MTETNKQPTKQNLQQHILKAGLYGGLLNGCAIILILGAAVGLGLWLDAAFDTSKRIFTFGLVLVSVPVTFVAVYYLGRWISARMAPPQVETKPEPVDFLEEHDRGKN